MINPEVCPECGDTNCMWLNGTACKDRQIAQLKARVEKLERVAGATKDFEKALTFKLSLFTKISTSEIGSFETLKELRRALKDLEAP